MGENRHPVTPHGIAMVPGWMPYPLQVESDSALFSYSDRQAQEKLGFWREQRLAG